MVNWDDVRKRFPAVTKSVYLNTASGSPLSDFARQEAVEFYDDVLMNGDSNFRKWLERTEKIRGKIAKLIGADKSEIAFIPNTSFGMNIVAEMLIDRGDVITMEDEFPSSTIPFLNKGFRLNFVKPYKGTYSTENIGGHITKDTKILVTSHVQYSTGFKQDLVELGKFCKRNGLIYVVNATQSIGAMPIDVKKAGIDFLVFSSVKWLLTGDAIGAIYISKKAQTRKWPVAGWLSVKHPFRMDNKKVDFKNNASILEIGGQCFPSIFVLGKAVDFISEIGMENVQKRIYELNDYLMEKLSALNLKIVTPFDRKYRSGITVIKVENAEDIVKKLSGKNIIISARKDGLRISVHIYNNEKDIDKFTAELEKIL